MNLPTKITFIRICMVPVFVIFLLIDNTACRYISAIIFIVAALTDSLDGYLARSRNLVSNLGKFLDPLADKILVCAALICLVAINLVPAWVLIIIVFREFAVTGLRTLVVADGLVVAASRLGKIKTVSQMLAVIFLILANLPWCYAIGTVLLYVALFFTVYSGVDYFLKCKSVLFNSK